MRRASWLLLVSLAACGGESPADMGADAAGEAGTDSGASIDLGPAPDAGCTTDADGDGHRSTACGGDDCDDTDPNRYPGHSEVCDAAGHDEDCNPATLGPDADGDGFVSTRCCNTQPSGPLLCGTDCDDTSPEISPTAPEVCDARDDNCDGMVDEGVRITFYRDADMDGFGDDTMATMSCTPPTGYVLMRGDCDDARAQTHPGAIDDCNGIDDDCNGVIDDAMHTGYFADCDADGYGAVGATPTIGCTPPSAPPTCTGTGTWATNALDCDDTNATIHPSATELCDAIDNDCDGTVDGAPATTWCTDPSRTAPLHEATATCTAGACSVGICMGAHLDCTPAAGCETPVTVSDCGRCGHTCRGWGGTVTCSGDVCTADVVDVVAGHGHACALTAAGAVACWGDNSQGELGDGTTASHDAPTLVPGVSDAVEIASGAQALSTCARRADGSVVCWGYNRYGQLGDGTTTNRVAPTPVAGLTNATNIAVAIDRACAVRADGSVVCWGLNTAQAGIGDGLATHSACSSGDCALTPVVVAGVADAVEVVCGTGMRGSFSCARRATGAVVCWGNGEEGQLGGDGGLTTSPTPSAVVGLADAVDLAAGVSFACARRSSGAVACWGLDTHGQLGDGTTGTMSCAVGLAVACNFRPTPVSGLTDATALATGNTHACARRASGAVACWGWNFAGMLGALSSMGSTVPVAVAGITDATRLAAADAFTCAVRAAGGVACWGSNALGGLGDGTMADHSTPAPTLAP